MKCFLVKVKISLDEGKEKKGTAGPIYWVLCITQFTRMAIKKTNTRLTVQAISGH